MNVETVVSLVTSAGTLTHLWFVGRKVWWAWLIGLANQVVWAVFIVVFDAWGLLPLLVGMVVVMSTNAVQWHREATAPARIVHPDQINGPTNPQPTRKPYNTTQPTDNQT